MTKVNAEEAEQIKRYCQESLFFLCGQFLGYKDWDVVHDDVERFLRKPARKKALMLPRGHLKCLTGDQMILVKGGHYKTVKDLEIGDEVWSLSDDFRGRWNPIVGKQSNGIRKVKRMVLRSGKIVRAAGNHPFFIYREWRPLDDLKIGDRIASSRFVPFGDMQSDEPLASFLGYMIGDGSCGRMMFTNQREDVRKHFIRCLYSLGGNGKEYFPENRSPYVSVNALRNLLREHGLYGLLSADKFVPKHIYRMGKAGVSSFLKALYTCDGTASTGRGAISYCTISRRLADDVQRLLNKFSIRSIIYSIDMKVKGEPYRAYHVNITGTENVNLFLDEIGFFGEKGAKASLLKKEKSSHGRWANLDTVPHAWKKDIPSGWSFKMRENGIRTDNNYGTTRSKVLEVGEFTDNEFIKKISSSDIYWDEIVDISEDGEEEVFDIEVERDHNFCINDVFSHNTSFVTIGYTIQSLLKNPNTRILIGNGVWDIARSFLSEIKAQLEQSQLKYLFGDFQSARWNADEIIVKQRTKPLKEPTVATTGVEAETTGGHYDIIILDDLIGLQNSQTPEQRAKVKRFRRSMINLLEPGGLLIEIGTRWHLDDTFSEIFEKEMKYYNVMVKKVVEPDASGKPRLIFPKHFAKKFDEVKKDWTLTEDPYCMDYVDHLKASMPLDEFSAQYLNEPFSSENQLFKPEMFKYWNERPRGLFIAMAVDLAISEARTADETAIVVCGMDKDWKLYVLDYLKGQWRPSVVIDNIFQMRNRWKPNTVGMETNGFQKTLKLGCEEEMRRRRDYFPIEEIKNGPERSKAERIKTLEPFYRNGNVFHAAWMKGKDLEGQLQTFPKGKRDDIIDAESMCLPLLHPGISVSQSQEDDWDRAIRMARENNGRNEGFFNYGK